MLLVGGKKRIVDRDRRGEGKSVNPHNWENSFPYFIYVISIISI